MSTVKLSFNAEYDGHQIGLKLSHKDCDELWINKEPYFKTIDLLRNGGIRIDRKYRIKIEIEDLGKKENAY